MSRNLAGVPREDPQVLNRIKHLKATVLQLYARWPEARDLLHENPVLLRLVAERYASDPRVWHHVPGWLLKPHRELLAWLFDHPLRNTQVRFLQRLVLDRGDRSVLGAVRRCLLRHFPKVPPGLLALVLEVPQVAELTWLRDELAATLAAGHRADDPDPECGSAGRGV